MHQVTEFIARHWALAGLFIAALILLIVEEARRQAGSGNQLSPQQVTDKINREKALVIDIRPLEEFNQGHIAGAINLTPEVVEKEPKEIIKAKNKPIIIICHNGQKSALTASRLKKLGYNQVCVLEGGIKAWKSANIPLV